jgi:hypothetical protein
VAHIESAGLQGCSHRDITSGIIEALHRMPAVTEPLIRRQEGIRQRIYQRFFGERVLVDSLLSHTSGRLRFFLLSAARGLTTDYGARTDIWSEPSAWSP